MPTLIAHAAVGGALACLAPRGAEPRRLALAAAACAVLPDLDVAGLALGVPYGHPLGHRGLTHGLPFAAALGLAVAPLVTPGRSWRAPARLAAAALLALATASHGALDAATDAGRGVGLWIPFHAERYAWPWRPLPTSPLGVGAFLRGDAAAILAFELRWIVAPAALPALALAALRRRRGQPLWPRMLGPSSR